MIAVARTQVDLDDLYRCYPDLVERWKVDVLSSDLIASIDALPKLDVLVNDAGTNRLQPVLEVDDQTLDTLIGTNIRAGCCKSHGSCKRWRLNHSYFVANGPCWRTTPRNAGRAQAPIEFGQSNTGSHQPPVTDMWRTSAGDCPRRAMTKLCPRGFRRMALSIASFNSASQEEARTA